jgi:hypothetical protein
MANKSLCSTEAQSQLIDKLFDALSAIPPLVHCRKCGTELLHANATFSTLAGKEWTLALPRCPQCEVNKETTKCIHPRGRYAIGLKSRGSNRSCGAKDSEKVPD